MQPTDDIFIELLTLCFVTLLSFVPLVLSVWNKRGKARIALWLIIPVLGLFTLHTGAVLAITLVGLDVTLPRKK